MPGPIRCRGLLFLAALTPYAFLFAAPLQQKPKVSFSKEVAPILKAHCASCHSGAAAAGGLDLANAKLLVKSRDVVAGKPDGSVLLQRIKGLGGKPKMPMGLPPLTADDTATIERWIAEGANLDEAGGTHWAYVAPVASKVPELDSSWVHNPIDAFILQRLKKEGLRPSPEASKETLLRRVTLDLTGLPPTPQEIDAFVADKSPNAYEKVVDRLLASPHYGEKQARMWLDLARYADSNGYEKDLKRTAWQYRDWLINSFNQNLPYDQFTVKQLAGDLLPNATLEDKVATGFHRNTMFNQEGGVDQEEAHFAVVLDRVDTTATVWLGSTMGCARCHDHKYDPFSQNDYYKMAAFFSNTTVYPRGPKEVGEEKWFEAEIPVPTAEQQHRRTELNAKIATAEKSLSEPNAELDQRFENWKRNIAKVFWTPLRPVVAEAADKTTLAIQPDGSVMAGGANPSRATYRLTLPASEVPITGIRIEALPDTSLTANGPGRSDNGNFVVTGVKVTGNDVAAAASDFIQPQFGIDRLDLNDTRTGWAILGGIGKPHELALALQKTVPANQPVSLEIQSDSRFPQHTLGHFRVSVTSAEYPLNDLMPAKIHKAVDEIGSGSDKELRAYFRSVTPALYPVRRGLSAWRTELGDIDASVPSAQVMEEKPHKGPLTEFVRKRGEFMNKTEAVTAGTPAVLPKLVKPDANRLDLARWLVRRDNPLTARVQINRMWESYFGRGLVETSEDFGTRGSKPSHPELLDWLAIKFMNSGWNMKEIHRLIVTSSTYRQASTATPALIAKDPQNVLLARGPRFRMEAEAIRDTALAASGLLSANIGGPSVFPYQPDGVWDSPYSGENWMPSTGKDRFRRSLYTFWKRTSTYPIFTAFDATSRESCTVRRTRTNTPLQALAMLNDKEMIEAAAALGERMRRLGKTEGEQLSAGFRLCTGRRPRTAETARLKELLAKLESRYSQHPADAKKLGPTPTDAAWTMVGNVLLNLDETMTKE